MAAAMICSVSPLSLSFSDMPRKEQMAAHQRRVAEKFVQSASVEKSVSALRVL
jgi:hypothetical protein